MFLLLLYIFVFLHQTATRPRSPVHPFRCISLFSYIKPQLVDMANHCITCCISLFSYIKPQQTAEDMFSGSCCISLFSYIKPQHLSATNDLSAGCISLFSYIKPQPYLREVLYIKA